MLNFAKHAILVFFGFSSGVVIAGAVFAFISVLGVVPRLAQKTGTAAHIRVYEDAITIGGILGTILGFLRPHLPLGKIFAALFALCVGVFYGCVAVSLAEILDVIPIMTRRARIKQGMFFFITAIALGKMLGSLAYFFLPGYYHF